MSVSTKLACERLEQRDNPAGTFGLTQESAPWGEQGSNALSVTAGGLEVGGDEAGDSYATVQAQSPLDAVRQALTGGVTVGGHLYNLTPATLSDNPADQLTKALAELKAAGQARVEAVATGAGRPSGGTPATRHRERRRS